MGVSCASSSPGGGLRWAPSAWGSLADLGWSPAASSFPERLLGFLLPKLESGNERVRVGTLTILRQIINSACEWGVGVVAAGLFPLPAPLLLLPCPELSGPWGKGRGVTISVCCTAALSLCSASSGAWHGQTGCLGLSSVAAWSGWEPVLLQDGFAATLF